MEDLEKYGVLNFEKDKNYIDILIKLKEQPDAISFLFEYKKEDCKNWNDLTLESDNRFLTKNDIKNIEKCIDFMNQLGTKEKIKTLTDIQLITTLRDLIAKDNNDIKTKITEFVNNYGPIKELIKSNLTQTETFNRKICNIFDNSTNIHSTGQFLKTQHI